MSVPNRSTEPSEPSPETGQTEQKPKPTSTKRSASRKWLIRILYLGYLAALLYGGAYLFYYIKYYRGSKIPMTDVELVWRHYYEELWKEDVLVAEPSQQDDVIDVLVLGGSVAEQAETALRQEFQKTFNKEIKLYCVARAAHNSRDSVNKFKRLYEKDFDCIIVYHGINDVGMNYVPASQYRDDYTHCSWYGSFERNLKRGTMTMTEITSQFADAIGRHPEEQDLMYGDEIKTRKAFHDNLAWLANQAQANDAVVVLMSFAWYIPKNYTKQRMAAGELDYVDGQYDMPVEKWGRVQDIPKMLTVHNEAAAEVAKELNTVWVDQARLLTSNTDFCDVCHLSEAGCIRFAKNTLAAITRDGRLK